MRTIILIIAVFAAAIYSYTKQKDSEPLEQSPNGLSITQQVPARSTSGTTDDAIETAIARQQSNIQVRASGVVDKIFGDDNEGSRHQRFIVKLPSGHTVLIAHNIDLASRVSPLAVGDQVEFSGEYEWNNKGGVVHWTHRDPGGKHAAGWIKHAGQMYQ
jgi:hypothetical protein